MHAAPTRQGKHQTTHKQAGQGLRRGQDPALQSKANNRPTANPARGKPLPGGMYAAPTNKGTVYTDQKRCCVANGHGPHACGPYKPTGNSRYMGKAGAHRRASTAGSRPRPTKQGRQQADHKPRAMAHPYKPSQCTSCSISRKQSAWKNSAIEMPSPSHNF